MEAPRLKASLAMKPDTADFRTRHKSPIVLPSPPRAQHHAVTEEICGRFVGAPKHVGSRSIRPSAGVLKARPHNRTTSSYWSPGWSRHLTWLNKLLFHRPILSRRGNLPASAPRGIGVLRRLPDVG